MIIRVGVGRDGGGTVAELALSSSTITVVGVGKDGGGGGDWRYRWFILLFSSLTSQFLSI